ncbi:MAG: hypothetical protein K0S28_1312 [Paucimonas sp.]|nr:hypothetical protein [Paucimonas sp.]
MKLPCKALVAACVSAMAAGCQPSEPPPDIIKTQREALNKAKALEGQMQQQAQERMQAEEEQQK